MWMLEVFIVNDPRRVMNRIARAKVDLLTSNVARVNRVGRIIRNVHNTCALVASTYGLTPGHLEKNRIVPVASEFGAVQKNAVEDED